MTTRLNWYNSLQYIAMVLVALAIPLDWNVGRVSVWFTLLLGAVSVLKLVADRHVGNPTLRRTERIGLWLMVAYPLLYAIGILYSGDKVEALAEFRVKAVLLVCPLVALLSDTSYLNARLKRGLLASLVGGVLLRIVGCAIRQVCLLAAGKSSWSQFFASFIGHDFDPRHHSYSALYAVVAVAVLMIYSLGGVRRTRKQQVLSVVGCLVLMLYVMVVDSRAGNLALSGVALGAVCWVAFVRRRWLHSALMVVMMGGLLLCGPMLLHGDNRLADTFNNLATEQSDVRIDINRSSIATYKGSPLFGYSPGDYHEALKQTFEDENFDSGIFSKFNCHNQYAETLLALGIVGFVEMMAMLVWPLYAAVRRRRAMLLAAAITFVVALNLLFESMLERQMGLQYLAFCYMLIYLIVSKKEKKFGQSVK